MSNSQQEDAFVIASQLIAMHRAGEKELAAPLSMQAIVDTILFPHHELSQTRLQEINKHIHSRRLYKDALTRLCTLQSKAQVAASSQLSVSLLMTRSAEGFSIKMVKDPENNTQAFLLLSLHKDKYNEPKQAELFSEDAASGVFLHCEWEDEFYFVHLNQGTGNNFQSILSVEQDVFHALCQHDSQLYLSAVPRA